MRKMILKWSVKIAGQLYLAGTIVTALDATDPDVQKLWPGIRANQQSQGIAVRFPDRTTPTLLHKTQVGKIA